MFKWKMSLSDRPKLILVQMVLLLSFCRLLVDVGKELLLLNILEAELTFHLYQPTLNCMYGFF